MNPSAAVALRFDGGEGGGRGIPESNTTLNNARE